MYYRVLVRFLHKLCLHASQSLFSHSRVPDRILLRYGDFRSVHGKIVEYMFLFLLCDTYSLIGD